MKRTTLFMAIIVTMIGCSKIQLEFNQKLKNSISTISQKLGIKDTVRVLSISHDNDTVIKYDTIVQTNTIIIIDTTYPGLQLILPYTGDSLNIFTQTDTGIRIRSVEVADMTTLVPTEGFGRYFVAIPDPNTHFVTVPAYPICVVTVTLEFNSSRSAWVDLIGFAQDHIYTTRIRYVTGLESTGNFSYIIPTSIFTIHARNF